MSKWLLPANLADVLPAEARRIEELRRRLLDLYRSYGFALVAPPLVEYLDSLLPGASGSGVNNDLRLRTCQLVDQLSGRTLGVRADMTAQVTRIDAQLLNHAGVTRLCYCGSVLHARPRGLLSDREQWQIGAELYGHAGVEADSEIIHMALESIACAGVCNARLDLNHPGVFHALVAADPALAACNGELRQTLATKDKPGLQDLARRAALSAASADALMALVDLYGEADVVTRARKRLPPLPALGKALDDLDALIAALPDDAAVTVDLADVGSGYSYHTGATFSIYAQGWHDALVKGGRYDGLGAAYGRARPATGFSLDLRKLSAGLNTPARTQAIRAPWGFEPSLRDTVRALRAAGEIVIQLLPGQSPDLDEFDVDRELVQDGQGWKVVVLGE